MKCPVCGGAELFHDTRDMPYTYKGQSIIIPALTGDYCPACGDGILDDGHGDRLGAAAGAFVRQVDSIEGMS